MRLLFILLLLWSSPVWVAANTPQVADSLPPKLYNPAENEASALRSRFSTNYFGIYSLHQLDSSDWAKFTPVHDPHLQVKASPMPDRADYRFYILLFIFLGLVIGIARDQQFFLQLFRASINYRLSIQLAREQVANRTAASVAYVLLFNLLLGLFLLFWLQQLDSKSYLLRIDGAWLLLFLLITLIYAVKYVFYKFLGVLFGLREQASYYLSQVFLMNRVLVFLLLPVLALLYFNPFIQASGLIAGMLFLLVLALILRYIRGIRYTRLQVKANSIHFILYFCAVEILPTLIIAKLLLNV
jgi:hypothetical protein